MEEQQRQEIARISQAYETASIMKLRLDTNPLLEKIELFLRGEKLVFLTDENGRTHKDTIPIGYINEKKETERRAEGLKPSYAKANEVGVQTILNHVTAICNPQVVQGNFNKEMYQNYVFETRIDIAKLLMVNLYEWEISPKDYEGIINFIMSLSKPFMSRLIDNKERDSYGGTFRTHETLQTSPQKKGMLDFLRGDVRNAG